ncbi:MAG: glucose-6-phosphate isomerase [Limisphaerales bacterium]
MKFNTQQLWARYQKYYREYPPLGLAIDISRMNFGDDWFAVIAPRMEKAFRFMDDLEKGAVANPDEKRMVGHYWLRNPTLAPNAGIRSEIEGTLAAIKRFAAKVHSGDLHGAGGPFKNLLVIGIGGSALGPQLVAHALGHPTTDKLEVFFFDNSDPDGMDKVFASIGHELGQTLCVTISKSGGTKETRNGMLEAKAAFEMAGLEFESHAVAVTGTDSQLDRLATSDGWLASFPMWDWVGGRTSETSAVGLLPAALQGINIDQMLSGARACDELTRLHDGNDNPASLLACMWYYIGNGRGEKDMVVLPYKDRLELFSRYLQQLVMESLGKELDRDNQIVHQGIAVYGNKGSTDQHAYVQQLRDGVANFFVTFIEVLKDRQGPTLYVEPDVTAGDYLNGFFLGTRQALYEKDRESMTLTVRDVSPFSIGMLIALFERAVGLYASLVNINAYHQPGVEAGKKAAQTIIELQSRTLDHLKQHKGRAKTLKQIAEEIDCTDQLENLFKICEHLASNPSRGIQKERGQTPFDARYTLG